MYQKKKSESAKTDDNKQRIAQTTKLADNKNVSTQKATSTRLISLNKSRKSSNKKNTGFYITPKAFYVLTKTKHISTQILLKTDRKDLLILFNKLLLRSNEDAVKVFKVIHYKHNGLKDSEISPNKLRRLLKLILQRELPIDKSPRTLLAVLQTMQQTNPQMQIDILIRKGGIFGGTTESIPYTIAKSNQSISTKIEWLKGLMDDTAIGRRFDLNRRVGNGGNLFLNSYIKLHIHDIKWYIFLIQKMHLAVNSKQKGKTLKDFVLQDMKSENPPSICAELMSLLETCGGKTRVELGI